MCCSQQINGASVYRKPSRVVGVKLGAHHPVREMFITLAPISTAAYNSIPIAGSGFVISPSFVLAVPYLRLCPSISNFLHPHPHFPPLSWTHRPLVPTLAATRTTRKRPTTLAGTYEGPSTRTIDLTSRSRGEFSLWGFLSKFWGLPGIVICGQLLLQGAAWGFFGAIWLRGLISIPSFGLPPAVWFKPVAWLCTQISTGLAGLSSL
jgi:hypothetical protein